MPSGSRFTAPGKQLAPVFIAKQPNAPRGEEFFSAASYRSSPGVCSPRRPATGPGALDQILGTLPRRERLPVT